MFNIHHSSKSTDQRFMNPLNIYSRVHRQSEHADSHFIRTGRNLVRNSPNNKQLESLHLAHSIVNLEDEKFIRDEISQFESKLNHPSSYKGFSWVARQQSIMLTSTQGYRNYKSQKNKNNKKARTEQREVTLNKKPAVKKLNYYKFMKQNIFHENT